MRGGEALEAVINIRTMLDRLKDLLISITVILDMFMDCIGGTAWATHLSAEVFLHSTGVPDGTCIFGVSTDGSGMMVESEQNSKERGTQLRAR